MENYNLVRALWTEGEVSSLPQLKMGFLKGKIVG